VPSVFIYVLFIQYKRRALCFVAKWISCLVMIFQHHVPRNTAVSTSPLQHDTRQPKTGLPQNYNLLLAPPRPDVARSSLKNGRSQSSVGRSTSSKHPRTTRLRIISACQDVPCGRYTLVIQYYDEMQLRVN
jgi:hypothetical protein